MDRSIRNVKIDPELHLSHARTGRSMPWLLMATVVFGLHCLPAQSQPAKTDKIGQLLYESNCLSCHLAKADWREKRLVNDWDSMKTQIRRWQVNLGLRWSEEQVDQVAWYLNRRYYKLAAP